jgi:hypothetical protein
MGRVWLWEGAKLHTKQEVMRLGQSHVGVFLQGVALWGGRLWNITPLQTASEVLPHIARCSQKLIMHSYNFPEEEYEP